MDREQERSGRKVGNLTYREIQAPLAACLIRGFAEAIGRDRAMEIASAAIQADARAAGRSMAERFGGNTLAELARIVREVWAENGALEIRIHRETDLELCFDVLRCRYAELYDRLSMKELGVCLSCSRDEPFLRGFNPDLEMIRTQTIMEGAPLCDFRFHFSK